MQCKYLYCDFSPCSFAHSSVKPDRLVLCVLLGTLPSIPTWSQSRRECASWPFALGPAPKRDWSSSLARLCFGYFHGTRKQFPETKTYRATWQGVSPVLVHLTCNVQGVLSYCPHCFWSWGRKWWTFLDRAWFPVCAKTGGGRCLMRADESMLPSSHRSSRTNGGRGPGLLFTSFRVIRGFHQCFMMKSI